MSFLLNLGNRHNAEQLVSLNYLNLNFTYDYDAYCEGRYDTYVYLTRW